MNRDLVRYAGLGALIVAVLVAVVLYWNRGAHVVLEGAVQKVRTQEMDERSVVVVADFRFVNPSDYPFIVRDTRLLLEDAGGKRLEGMMVGEVDAERLFRYYPLLGPKYNRTLIVRDRIEPRQSMDRMIAARFEIPETAVKTYRKLIIRVEDVDGTVSEIVTELTPHKLS
jgi:hypothetical protein